MKACAANTRRFSSNQRGMVLVTSLLLLVVMTILAVSMFRSFGLDEKIAGNVREKQKALNAAETAEQYAESWLAQGNNTGQVACSIMVASNVGQVCSNTMTSLNMNPAVLPWAIAGVQVGVNYVPAVGSNIMTMSTSGGAGNYYTNPVFYIGYLGSTTVSRITTTFYQIDAVGYGGSADAAAVVEATYSTTSSVQCLSCG
jgi:type IV pilus assembly protein PilX